MIITQTEEKHNIQNDVVKFLMDYSDRENVIDSVQLAKRFDIKRIDVRNIVNKARSEGVPICSSRHGYYFSIDPADIQKTVNSLSGRVRAMNKAINGISAYIGNQKYYESLGIRYE